MLNSIGVQLCSHVGFLTVPFIICVISVHATGYNKDVVSAALNLEFRLPKK